MISFFCIAIMLAGGYAYFREGLFTAIMMFVNVIAAGIVTFQFWEPLADALEPMFAGGFLAGTEDFICMIVLFSVALAGLRFATNKIVDTQLDFPAVWQQIGGSAVGVAIGYLVSGFMIASFQTLPWHQNFMGFAVRDPNESAIRRFFPPDRVWLSTMRHAGAYPFAKTPTHSDQESIYRRYPTFDAGGTFEIRYFRYRRYDDQGNRKTYNGELDNEIRGNP